MHWRLHSRKVWATSLDLFACLMQTFNDLIAIFIQGFCLYGCLHVDFPNSISFVSVVFEQQQTWSIYFEYWLLITLILLRLLFFCYIVVATVREKSGKNKNFQGQGKVREFFKKSGKIFGIVKVSERSGDSVFRSIVHKTSSTILKCIFSRKRWKVCCKASKAINWTLYAWHM